MPEHPDRDRAKLQTLTPGERARLAAILARLASPYAGERAAAGLLASAFIAKHGLAWAELATLLQPRPDAPAEPELPSPKPDRRRRSGKGWRGFCRRRLVLLGQALDRLT